MNPIDIIKEALEKCQEILPYAITDDEGKWNGEVRSVIKELDRALDALDRATIKVDDDEIDKMVLDDLTDDSHVGLGLTHEGALAIARTFLGRGLRIARDNWLAPSPWISVETLPDTDRRVLVKTNEGHVLFADREDDGYWLIEGVGTEYEEDPIVSWTEIPK